MDKVQTTVEETEYKGANINKAMKLFFLKLVGLIIAWESLYIFLLKPLRIPDAFLTHTLTGAVSGAINLFFRLSQPVTWVIDNVHKADHIQQYGKTILTIFDDCNGLDLYLIYLVFLVLLPFSIKRKLKFSLIGIVSIFIGNVFRCMGLYWIYVHHRGIFEFNHHYVFTIMMYLIILVCWIFFTRKPKVNEIG